MTRTLIFRIAIPVIVTTLIVGNYLFLIILGLNVLLVKIIIGIGIAGFCYFIGKMVIETIKDLRKKDLLK